MMGKERGIKERLIHVWIKYVMRGKLVNIPSHSLHVTGREVSVNSYQ